MRGVVVVVICLHLGGWQGRAHADTVELHTRQLRAAPEFKLRLSAALSLAKTRDQRAIAAMAYALENDTQSTVRRVAALSLARMVDDTCPQPVRSQATDALERAAAADRDVKVRGHAARALTQLQALRELDSTFPAVFINVASISDKSRQTPQETITKMHSALSTSLSRSAPHYSLRWPSGSLPTSSELIAHGTRAYFVGASVAELDVVASGSRAEIRCSVSVRITPWAGSNGSEQWSAHKTAFAQGNGKVAGANTAGAIAIAKQDCVLAVSDAITKQQVVPFLRRLVASAE